MLKRLEIQCVFKELVKDIVVKGQTEKEDSNFSVLFFIFIDGATPSPNRNVLI